VRFGTNFKAKSQQFQDTMTEVSAARFEIEEIDFVAFKRVGHGLLRSIVDEFADVECSTWSVRSYGPCAGNLTWPCRGASLFEIATLDAGKTTDQSR
jgi:hypothetical protein